MKILLRPNHAGSYQYRTPDRLMLKLEHAFDPVDSPPWIEGQYMLTHALFSRLAGSEQLNYKAGPYGFLVRPVQEDDVLVCHQGFCCRGAGRATTASATDFNGNTVTLTPGRLHGGGLYVAPMDGANGSPPLIPGLAYIKRSQIESGTQIVRIEGVPYLSDTVLGASPSRVELYRLLTHKEQEPNPNPNPVQMDKEQEV